MHSILILVTPELSIERTYLFWDVEESLIVTNFDSVRII